MSLPALKVHVSGPEHTGKTSLIAVIAKALEDHGVTVVLQRADGQLDKKLENIEQSIERVNGATVFLSETQTAA